MTQSPVDTQPRLFGHPAGLYTLFFAEMWERFSYYGMRALLVFYMIKGFLGYGDSQAYSVYGSYAALVYMTPFIGGMLADRILGQRIAVIIGGLLMAGGHLLMTVESEWPFFFALALLITGNGFFKPNISTTVGMLYKPGDGRRDDGFNIFYLGINLGASISPLLCGFVGETYGWHYGFGLATIGMLVGIAIFVMPTRLSSVLILMSALLSAVGLLVFRPDNLWAIGINIFVAICLLISAFVAIRALSLGGLPVWAGARPKGVDSRHDWKVYAGILVAIPVFALLVSGFSPLTQPPIDPKTGQVAVAATSEQLMSDRLSLLDRFGVDPKIGEVVRSKGIANQRVPRGKSYQFFSDELIERVESKSTVGGVFLREISRPAGLVLTLLGVLAFGYLILETIKLDKIPRERMMAALVLIFFQMLFFAFFEQAGSSMNNFTDRNIDRVGKAQFVDSSMIGQTIRLEPTQAQLGFLRDGKVFTLSDLEDLRNVLKEYGEVNQLEISWTITEENLGMGIAGRLDELPASIFQSFNAIFILIFALVFNWLWSALRKLRLEPSAPLKFGLGLIQLGLGFGALWLGAEKSNGQGMVHVGWLTLGILLHTTGELCLSPVGLSSMTKLSPKRLVSTLMGAWFLATAFSEYLAGIISTFTSVESEEGFPPPSETVHVYGSVFWQLCWIAIGAGLLCALLSPLLNHWMHQGKELEQEPEELIS
jgi:dipeptide/tripeptide permease